MFSQLSIYQKKQLVIGILYHEALKLFAQLHEIERKFEHRGYLRKDNTERNNNSDTDSGGGGHYNPDQPRVPAGNPDGGQWTEGEAENDEEQPDIDKAIEFIQNNAESSSLGRCAAYVRRALNAGGFKLRPPPKENGYVYAKNYGSSLRAIGFRSVASSSRPSTYPAGRYHPSKGDVVVIQSTSGSYAGHMAMYDGERWISDFTQPGFWPGPTYRNEKPSYIVYRYSK